MFDMRSGVAAMGLAILVLVVLAVLKLANDRPAVDGSASQRLPASQIQVHAGAVSKHVPAGQLIRPGELE